VRRKGRTMPGLDLAPPFTAIEAVTEFFHGVTITDPYRWLEDQGLAPHPRVDRRADAIRRSYLDLIPGREKIRQRIREFLVVETYDSLQRAGNRYFFRKRLPDQEQPCIYMREGSDGQDSCLSTPRNGEPESTRP